MKAGQNAAEREGMLAAARLNWRLWTIFQSELLDPESPVPLQLRANILSLSRYVDARTIDFVADPQPAKLDSLITINRELASGLYASLAAARLSMAEGGGHQNAADSSPTTPTSTGAVRLTI